MLKVCSYCSKEINEGNSIHFGFDHMCCSAMCRTQIGTIIIHKDPRLFNPEKWKTISKKNSIIDLENLTITNKTNISDVGKIRKTKSFKKDISLLKINDEIINPKNTTHLDIPFECPIDNQLNAPIDSIFDTSCSIILSTFSTLREYLNFTKLSSLKSTDLSLIRFSILPSSSTIFTKLYF